MSCTVVEPMSNDAVLFVNYSATVSVACRVACSALNWGVGEGVSKYVSK